MADNPGRRGPPPQTKILQWPGRGGFSSVHFSSEPQPREGRGIQVGGRSFLGGFGAFLNSLFHSEHFECTHVRRGQPAFTVHLK